MPIAAAMPRDPGDAVRAVVVTTTLLADIPATAGLLRWSPAGTIAVDTTFGARRAWLVLLFLPVAHAVMLLLSVGHLHAKDGEGPSEDAAEQAAAGGHEKGASQVIEAVGVHRRLHDVSRFR
jgi:putative exporter of polyketide antibiotics